jgi:Domain of unknown function (DUF4338)/Transposase DNA-binding
MTATQAESHQLRGLRISWLYPTDRAGHDSFVDVCEGMDARQRLTSPDGLTWVRSRVSENPGLSRHRLAREVCEHFDWRDALGRPKEMACRKHLLQLERRGLIQLPPARYRARPQCRRKCAAPEDVPHCRGTLADLGSIELQAVVGGTAASRRWNALMDAYHPQGSGPLCGAQIRYMILGTMVGEIGGLAVSAPAWRLAARDQWLGWSDATRAANLSGILCNSRFLILPTISIKHLASHVLALLARRIVVDWPRRYGLSPWLMETCVEVERSGTCYRAANWIEIGLTAGRGRQDRHHKGDVPQKRVFLYPLCKATLERLCGERATPEPGWVHQEFGGTKLGDRRLQKRLFDLATAFFERPKANIPQACGTAAATKAAYRFFDHEHTRLQALLEPHRLATLARMRRERVVLVVRDTLSLNFSTHRAIRGIGPIGTKADDTQGLMLHNTLAFRPDGLPLGILATATLGRKDKSVFADTQDDRWAAIREARHCCPKTRIVPVGDCEGDIFAFLGEALQQNCDLLVRVKQNQAQLSSCPQSLPETGDCTFSVEPQGGQAARTARLSVRFARLALAAMPDLPLWAVWARECDAPEGVEPINWMLVTTVTVNTLNHALERVDWYARRSGMEVFQTILKSGCRVEDRQLATVDRLQACLAIDMVVAWRIHYLASSARAHPENSDAKRKVPAPRIAHRRAPDPEPLHRAHGA